MPNTQTKTTVLSTVASPYLLVPDAVVDEDEDAVECVEDTEGGSDGERRAVEEEESQRPGENHEEQQGDGAPQPGPAGVEEGGEEVLALRSLLVDTLLQEVRWCSDKGNLYAALLHK